MQKLTVLKNKKSLGTLQSHRIQIRDMKKCEENSVDIQDLNLEVGEDGVVLESKGIYNPVDFFLPCSVDQDVIDAKLDRNFNMLSVKMPVIH
ncbi:unnamed protein product [Leptidea sinapis]|uniref:PIH1D1/2/3 CS-like domain-containing protein n=1 Tax=Leptidea sinapis TaxID=189913 RepID=A0A5E4QWM2_9NEOP|nr:unnamed protein product [Leptidea sinapis]